MISYLSRLSPYYILEPLLKDILDDDSNMLDFPLSIGNVLGIIPRHGGLGIINLQATSKATYLASLLACLLNTDSVCVQQHLSLNVLQFDQHGQPSELNTLREAIASCARPAVGYAI